MTWDDLSPTQQYALRDIHADSQLQRVRGGYRMPSSDATRDVHTVRCINALQRAGLVGYTQLREAAFITRSGSKLIAAGGQTTREYARSVTHQESHA